MMMMVIIIIIIIINKYCDGVKLVLGSRTTVYLSKKKKEEKFTLEQAMKTQRGSRSIGLLFV